MTVLVMSVLVPILAYLALVLLVPLLLMFGEFIRINKFVKRHFSSSVPRILLGFFFVLIVYPTLYVLLAALLGTVGALILVPVPFIYVWLMLRMVFYGRASS